MVAKEGRDVAGDPAKDTGDRREKIKRHEKEKDKEFFPKTTSGRWKAHQGGLLFAQLVSLRKRNIQLIGNQYVMMF